MGLFGKKRRHPTIKKGRGWRATWTRPRAATLIDCKTSDVDDAARFWAYALGRSVDPGSHGNYRMLETPLDEPIVQIQRVDHESRVHIDIETDDIPAEVARLEKLGAKVANRLARWVVMQAPTGQRFCVVRIQRSRLPEERQPLGLGIDPSRSGEQSDAGAREDFKSASCGGARTPTFSENLGGCYG